MATLKYGNSSDVSKPIALELWVEAYSSIWESENILWGTPNFCWYQQLWLKITKGSRLGFFIKFGNAPPRNFVVPPANYACMDNLNIIVPLWLVWKPNFNVHGNGDHSNSSLFHKNSYLLLLKQVFGLSLPK